MGTNWSVEDVVEGYRWLGHTGFSELGAFHPEYRVGAENKDWNKDRYPVVRYVRTEHDVVQFVEKYGSSRLVCYGLNPRPRVFTNSRGYFRSALDSEIESAQTLLLDFDPLGKPSSSQLAAFDGLLDRTQTYFQDLGLSLPVRAETGRGRHLLLAYPAIAVRECPDIAQRQRQFRDDFNHAFARELASLEMSLDTTQDLRRMARIYGTAKPGVGLISKFYGSARHEDLRLREHLLGLPVREGRRSKAAQAGELPHWFLGLLEQDATTRELWGGSGKPSGDTSRSGFDFSLTQRLMALGHRNIDELATILALRPDGGVRGSGKSDSYIRRTIAAALVK